MMTTTRHRARQTLTCYDMDARWVCARSEQLEVQAEWALDDMRRTYLFRDIDEISLAFASAGGPGQLSVGTNLS
jgi:hypothetical protein